MGARKQFRMEEAFVTEREDRDSVNPYSPQDDPNTRSLCMTDFGQLPVQLPVRWIDIEEDERPPSPAIEYIRSGNAIDVNTLCARWEGLFKPYELERLRREEGWDVQRFQYRNDIMARALAESKAGDIEYQTQVINEDIMGITLMIDRVQADFDEGVEYRPVSGAGPFAYVKMPMTVDSKNKLGNLLVNLRNARASRVEIATKIFKIQHDIGENAVEVLRMKQTASSPEYRRALQASGLAPDLKFDSDADTIEGQVIDMVVSERGHG